MRAGFAFKTALLATALMTFFGLGAGQAFATHVACGDTITQDTALDSDLVDCPGTGIVIGADGVTLDLNGHSIDGRVDHPHFGYGVEVRDHDNVTLKNGTLSGFQSFGIIFDGVMGGRIRDVTISDVESYGIYLVGSERSVVKRNSMLRNARDGIVVREGSSGTRIERNTVLTDSLSDGIDVHDSDDVAIVRNAVTGAFDGIDTKDSTGLTIKRNRVEQSRTGLFVGQTHDTRVLGNQVLGGFLGIWIGASDRNLVEHNLVEGAGSWGIAVNPFSDFTVLRHNVALKNGWDGIRVFAAEGPAAGADTLRRNRADHNGELGIEAASDTIDGGGNRALGNGDPLQCLNVVCK